MNNSYDPILEIYESASVLKSEGFTNSQVSNFIFEACYELEKDVDYIIEYQDLSEDQGQDPEFLDYVSKSLGGILDSGGNAIKRVVIGLVMDSMGIDQGPIRIALSNAIQDLGFDDMRAFTSGNSDRICGQVFTVVAKVVARTVLETAGYEKLGLDPDGIVYNMLMQAFVPSDSTKGMPGALNRYMMKEVCPKISEQIDNMNPSKWFSGVGGNFMKNWNDNYKPLDFPKSDLSESQKLQMENFQKRMKRRLRKQMSRLLDGGRKDLTKFGGAFTKPRQKYSNAYVAK